MSTNTEISIDPNLEKHLESTPKLEKPAIQVEDEDLIPDEKPPECTTDQREQIFNLLQSQGFLDHNNPAKMANLIRIIKTMNYEEASAYAEGLRCNNSLSFSKALTKKLLKLINTYTLKYDIETATQIENDTLLIDEFTINLTSTINRCGKFKALLMYGLYIASGYLINNNTIKYIYEPTAQTGNHAPAPVPTDGGGSVSDGKNITTH